MNDERVELWREPSGFWRWRYVSERGDGSEDVRLLSNMEFTSEQAARDAAAVAYPDVAIHSGNHQDASGEQSGGPPKAILIAMIAAIAAGVVVRVRRRRTRSSRRRSPVKRVLGCPLPSVLWPG